MDGMPTSPLNTIVTVHFLFPSSFHQQAVILIWIGVKEYEREMSEYTDTYIHRHIQTSMNVFFCGSEWMSFWRLFFSNWLAAAAVDAWRKVRQWKDIYLEMTFFNRQH